MKKEKDNPHKFKDHTEAILKADMDFPATLETLDRIQRMHKYPIKTKEDVRFFVLMNYIRRIDYALNKSLDNAFLTRIQDNILEAGEKFLK